MGRKGHYHKDFKNMEVDKYGAFPYCHWHQKSGNWIVKRRCPILKKYTYCGQFKTQELAIQYVKENF